MIRRPLNSRFADKVRAGIKTTTMRDTAWPLGVPIMLYEWTGRPYASKQREIVAVVADWRTPVSISCVHGGDLLFSHEVLSHLLDGRPLWACEGFESQDEMEAWFRPMTKPGQTLKKYLMGLKPHSKKTT